MPNDISLGPFAGQIPNVVPVSKKPVYLVLLEETVGKSKVLKKFITVEKPELLNGFVQVKGIFSDSDEEEINKKFNDILTNSSKELFIEVMFPWHKICSIRSLVFRAK